MRNRIPCQRDAGTRLATALRRRPFSACNKGNRRRLHAGNARSRSTETHEGKQTKKHTHTPRQGEGWWGYWSSSLLSPVANQNMGFAPCVRPQKQPKTNSIWVIKIAYYRVIESLSHKDGDGKGDIVYQMHSHLFKNYVVFQLHLNWLNVGELS